MSAKVGAVAIRAAALAPILCAALAGSATDVRSAQRQVKEVGQENCSKGQYRFDPRDYRCLEVTVYEIRNAKRVPRIYHVWERRPGKR